LIERVLRVRDVQGPKACRISAPSKAKPGASPTARSAGTPKRIQI